MVEETPFYMWTIMEAWNWLIDVPVLGFVALILLVIGILLTAIASMRTAA